jgi:hypothetical protein
MINFFLNCVVVVRDTGTCHLKVQGSICERVGLVVFAVVLVVVVLKVAMLVINTDNENYF